MPFPSKSKCPYSKYGFHIFIKRTRLKKNSINIQSCWNYIIQQVNSHTIFNVFTGTSKFCYNCFSDFTPSIISQIEEQINTPWFGFFCQYFSFAKYRMEQFLKKSIIYN